MRVNRMMESVPYYYQYSRVFNAIQEAQASGYDAIETQNEDLQRQLYIATATWGLKFWEKELLIPVIETDSYEIRRSRVLSKWRSMTSQFSAKLIQNICEAFTNGKVDVSVNIPAGEVTITFAGTAGIPTNMDDLKFAVENIVHAHLGTQYKFMYTTWDKLDAQNLTFAAVETYSWDSLETAFALT